MTVVLPTDINGGNPSNWSCMRGDHSLYLHTTTFIVDGETVVRDYCRKCDCPACVARLAAPTAPEAV